MSATDDMITLERVSKTYPGSASPAVDAIDLNIGRGELLVLLGESGCGKTTTLKMINRLIEKTSGRITVDGEDIDRLSGVELRRRIGYVFQGIGLFPHMTIAQNVATVPRLLGWTRRAMDERTAELMALVGLEMPTFGHRYPRELSGGQQQRIGVARALAAKPDVLLMDEPFGALDPITRDELQDEFRAMQQRLNLTVVLVTHDMTEALLLADQIVVMHQGRIAGKGTGNELMVGADDAYVKRLMAMPKRQADRVEALARNEAS